MCGLGRLVLPAMLVGIVVGSIAGSLVGWLAAAAVIGVLLIVGRRRLSQGCGLPPQTGRPFEGLVHGETGGTLSAGDNVQAGTRHTACVTELISDAAA